MSTEAKAAVAPTSTSSRAAPPKAVPSAPKKATEMNAVEYAAAKASYIAANRRKW